ncbi:hypothetical protein [Actinoplanes auranticolor]|uniref:Uncharacterized protein n=1 Tax=Actinoplanes auranticolor TaxID=47988 RepID=A0A919VUC7_9ACTN|nr:hypothetical protein [Actinoplanes auranticolor]GIM79254.1 hypothetical protein Aau02nite_84850 [Actinoplanes auranticolor]
MIADDGPPALIGSESSIETDIRAMEEFAATLANEVQNGYDPHLQQVIPAMLTKLPRANSDFPELESFLTLHHEVQQQTFSNTFNFRDGTHHFAVVAKSISKEYASSDAFARAQVRDVNEGFDAASNPLRSETGTGENG